MKKIILSIVLVFSLSLVFSQKPTGIYEIPSISATFDKIVEPGWIILNSGTRIQYVVKSRVGVKENITTALASGKIALTNQGTSSNTLDTNGLKPMIRRIVHDSINGLVTEKMLHDTLYISNRPFKLYLGYLNQMDPDPVILTELENDIGDIAFDWDGSHYVINAVLSGAFTEGKTVATAITTSNGLLMFGVTEYAPNRITLELPEYSGSIINLLIEIRVYP